jgi:GntR family transcriptional regulator/MocR family aminotransferase
MDNVLTRISGLYEQEGSKNSFSGRSQGLYQRIFNLIRNAILNNDIPEGIKLPSTRLLAKELKISRSTIIKAYELLLFEGHLVSVPGSGHHVKNVGDDHFQPKPEKIAEFKYPELSEVGKSFQKTVVLQNTTDDISIAFRPGLPPLDVFPVNKWKNLTNMYWRHVKSYALTYSASSGTEQLKKTISDYLNFSRKIKCDPQQVIIVSGSVQSLYLIGNVVLNPGDIVILENTTFPNVHSIFKGLRANIRPVDVDEHGLAVSQLKEESHLKPKLLHTVPSCHYPTGVKMSLNRRLELLKWAHENGSMIIENDYEHEVNNFNDFLPSIFSLDNEQRTVFLGTFNRLLHPSIRVGYMVVPYYLLDAVEALLKHSHRFVPSSIQVVLSQFIEKNYIFNHIKNVIEVADERKELFDQTFRKSFDNGLTIEPFKTKSLHTLVNINNRFKDTELAAYFTSHNIITHTFSKCSVDDNPSNGLILGFSCVRPPVIKQKIQQMEKLFRGYNSKGKSQLSL